ncbi:hypothetical protein BDV98DRAFT_593105 [Pterulicium gracile]|uniref:Uncharacterized protein n=1 Tax=Pterulicium gracile TaxID=1884261 RepID=A0A5C3QGI6_9AGAR|nr:hypothetical protein BDV98DRAFT_593105 [Pterula gracilis]
MSTSTFQGPPRVHHSDQDISSAYPNDDTPKPISIYATSHTIDSVSNERHVVLFWTNSKPTSAVWCTQILPLSGIPGQYNMQNTVKMRRGDTSKRSDIYKINRSYTRRERNHIIELAKSIQFNPASPSMGVGSGSTTSWV